MALLEREKQAERPPVWARKDVGSRLLTYLRRALSITLVLLATCAGGYLALVGYHQSSKLSVGEIRMSVSPGHKGALDVYVPLVDWGARFEAIKAPIRLRVDLQTVDRKTATSLAEGQALDVELVREQATNAIKDYLIRLFALTVAAALTLGLLVAFAIRSSIPRLRWTAGVAVLTTIAIGTAMVLTIPPRGEIANPQYYAHGPDIPRALEAVEAARRSTGVLDQELNAQLVGLARLVIDPGRRQSLSGQPVITLASELPNNAFGVPVLERVADNGPVFFAGDLTDRGSPLETRLVSQAAHSGKPFVFVTGNHDSDYLARELASDGAIVLTRTGRLKPDGSRGPIINTIKPGIRVAGYDDPFERLSAESFKDRYDNNPSQEMQDEFLHWLTPLSGKVDVVMVHEPALIQTALAVLKDDPPERPIDFMVGHTHKTALDDTIPGVTVINGGSIGAGGTGNLTEITTMSVARFV